MAPAAVSPADQEAVARAWVECAGLGGLEIAVHPRDEMQAFLAAASPRRDAHRFEYLRSGHEAFVVVAHALAACGGSLDRAGRILDFACGCGRITRFFAHALGRERVVAAEIDAEALEFVRRTLGVATVPSASDPRTVQLPSDFDVVFAGSLFSHLPRPRFVAWLRRLGEALRDDGLLVFTTHGEEVCAPPAAAAAGFTFLPLSETTRLATSEYGSTFVQPELVCELARQAGLAIVGWVERELWDLQDVFVARRATSSAPSRIPSTPLLYGRIERAYLPRPGHAWIGGGTRATVPDTPLREVRMVVDGRDVAAASLGAPVRQAPSPRRDPYVTTEWYTEGDASWLAPGWHTVCALGVTASGRREAFGARGLRVGG